MKWIIKMTHLIVSVISHSLEFRKKKDAILLYVTILVNDQVLRNYELEILIEKKKEKKR